MRLALLFLLLPGLAAAQSVVNPSFETSALPLGGFNFVPPYGWNCSGTVGLWSPGASYYQKVPDGVSVVFINAGASCKQDLGQVAAGNYTFSVFVGNRADKAGASGSWTASAPGCTQSGSNGAIPPGTFTQITQSCAVPAGDLTVTLSCIVAQCDFDMVNVAGTPPVHPQTFYGFNFAAHLRYCTVCDSSDDSVNGLKVLTGMKIQIFQGLGSAAMLTVNATGDATGTVGIDVSQVPMVFNVVALDPSGSTLCTSAPVATYSQPANNCFQLALNPDLIGSWAMNSTSGISMFTANWTGMGLILRLDAATAVPRGAQQWLTP